MAGPSPVELTADCEHCLLEGGVVEIYDPLVAACRFGLPASTRCKLCGVTNEGVFDAECTRSIREIPANRCPGCEKELSPSAIDSRRCESCGAAARLVECAGPARFTTVGELEGALDAWAERERFPDRQALVAATFCEAEIPRLFDRLTKREPLEILADPFANMGVKTTGGPKKGAEAGPARTAAGSARPNTDSAVATAAGETVPMAKPLARVAPPEPRVNVAPPSAPPPSAPPRALVYPLVSVIAADGEIHPAERALVDQFLRSEGLPPLAEEEFRVHAPAEVARFVPKERREDVVRLMCESACCDGAPDESEKRVIKAYATAWHVDDEKVDFWLWGYESMNTSLARQLFLKLRRFVLSARWSAESPDTLRGDE